MMNREKVAVKCNTWYEWGAVRILNNSDCRIKVLMKDDAFIITGSDYSGRRLIDKPNANEYQVIDFKDYIKSVKAGYIHNSLRV